MIRTQGFACGYDLGGFAAIRKPQRRQTVFKKSPAPDPKFVPLAATIELEAGSSLVA